MAKHKNAASVVAAYLGIQELEDKARRARKDVAELVESGAISSSVMGQLIGITTSGVDQIVMRKKAGMYDNV